MTESESIIKEITARLVKIYNPEAIYLFGSYAWGTPELNSDYDIFIIVKNSEFGSADRIRIGQRGLLDMNVAVDILVYTEEELMTRKDHPSTLAHKVISRGVKLYEAA